MYNLAMATALLERINIEIDLVLLFFLFQTAQITIARVEVPVVPRTIKWMHGV